MELFFRAFFNKRERKLKSLLKYKKYDLNPSYLELIEDEVNNYIFYKCTGISTHKELREKILLVSRQYQIPVFYFKNAIQFVKLDNGNIKIKLTKFDDLSKWFNIIFGSVLLAASIWTLFIPVIFEGGEYQIWIYLYSCFFTLFFSLAGIFVLTQNEKLSAAKYIKKKLETS